MRIVIFAHSVISDWSHGNAHFLRGLSRALAARGHDVAVAECVRGWSIDNLVADHGDGPIREFERIFPDLKVARYAADDPARSDEIGFLTAGADLVIVHEWTDPDVADTLHRLHERGQFAMLFHDTHHRAVSAPDAIARLRPERFDGVLAFGESLVAAYHARFAPRRAWCFHEAADISLFRPIAAERDVDVIWIGNWGDGERSAEIRTFLVDPARGMPDLRWAVHGVRYPPDGMREVRDAGIRFRGWLPNAHVPEAFARARMTLHIPRGPYLDRLRGIPTIRPFEAMACGIPMICTPWTDSEALFRVGIDYLVADDPHAMRSAIRRLATDDDLRGEIAASGLQTVLERHTCDHRAEQLESICADIGL